MCDVLASSMPCLGLEDDIRQQHFWNAATPGMSSGWLCAAGDGSDNEGAAAPGKKRRAPEEQEGTFTAVQYHSLVLVAWLTGCQPSPREGAYDQAVLAAQVREITRHRKARNGCLKNRQVSGFSVGKTMLFVNCKPY